MIVTLTATPAQWLTDAELMLSLEQTDGTRHSLPLTDPRMATAWPIWLARLAECMDQERASWS